MSLEPILTVFNEHIKIILQVYANSQRREGHPIISAAIDIALAEIDRQLEIIEGLKQATQSQPFNAPSLYPPNPNNLNWSGVTCLHCLGYGKKGGCPNCKFDPEPTKQEFIDGLAKDTDIRIKYLAQRVSKLEEKMSDHIKNQGMHLT